jgi:hypothetical protein
MAKTEDAKVDPKCKNCKFQVSRTACSIHVSTEINDDYSCDCFQAK